MSDMQVAVGLGRETCLQASSVLPLGQVTFNLLFNEIEALLFCCLCLYVFVHT